MNPSVEIENSKINNTNRTYATGKRKNSVARVWLKKGEGKALYINIEQIEEDPLNSPISEYVKEKDIEVVQQQLFD